MKVGGIGIQFMDKKGKDVPGESFLYVNVVGWKYSRGEKKLHIEVGKTGGPIDKEVVVITAEGEEIGLLMRDHAKSVAKQLKEQKVEAKKAQAKMLEDAVGSYRIENPVTCRDGKELDSDQTETIEPGTVVEVTEAAVNSQGTTRLKCEQGWFSLKSHLAVKLDADGEMLRSFCSACSAVASNAPESCCVQGSQLKHRASRRSMSRVTLPTACQLSPATRLRILPRSSGCLATQPSR